MPQITRIRFLSIHSKKHLENCEIHMQKHLAYKICVIRVICGSQTSSGVLENLPQIPQITRIRFRSIRSKKHLEDSSAKYATFHKMFRKFC